jgi:hypothetical protein
VWQFVNLIDFRLEYSRRKEGILTGQDRVKKEAPK